MAPCANHGGSIGQYKVLTSLSWASSSSNFRRRAPAACGGDSGDELLSSSSSSSTAIAGVSTYARRNLIARSSQHTSRSSSCDDARHDDRAMPTANGLANEDNTETEPRSVGRRAHGGKREILAATEAICAIYSPHCFLGGIFSGWPMSCPRESALNDAKAAIQTNTATRPGSEGRYVWKMFSKHLLCASGFKAKVSLRHKRLNLVSLGSKVISGWGSGPLRPPSLWII